MSDTTEQLLETLRERERLLETVQAADRARLEEVRDLIARLRAPRRGRPRRDVVEMPARIGGAIAEPQPDDAA